MHAKLPVTCYLFAEPVLWSSLQQSRENITNTQIDMYNKATTKMMWVERLDRLNGVTTKSSLIEQIVTLKEVAFAHFE